LILLHFTGRKKEKKEKIKKRKNNNPDAVLSFFLSIKNIIKNYIKN